MTTLTRNWRPVVATKSGDTSKAAYLEVGVTDLTGITHAMLHDTTYTVVGSGGIVQSVNMATTPAEYVTTTGKGYLLLSNYEVNDVRAWGAKPDGVTDAGRAIQLCINSVALQWTRFSNVYISGHYKINKQVVILRDANLVGDSCTISSDIDDYIFVTGYINTAGDVVPNIGMSAADAVATARVTNASISRMTFVGVSKVMHFHAFNEQCYISDLLLVNCGQLGQFHSCFYMKADNVLIRGVKPGYEEWFAYVMGAATNSVKFHKVTVAERKLGELLQLRDQDKPFANTFAIYQDFVHDQCTYENVTDGVTFDMNGSGYKNINIYAEAVSGALFKTIGGTHKDMVLGDSNSWAYGVELMASLGNVSGDSTIHQMMQKDYNPNKPSQVFMSDSTARIIPAYNLSSFHDASGNLKDDNIAYNSDNANLFIDKKAFHGKHLVDMSSANYGTMPVRLSGRAPVAATNEQIGFTGVRYEPAGKRFVLSTQFAVSRGSCFLVTLNWFKTDEPSVSGQSNSICLGGFIEDFAGQFITYGESGGLYEFYVGDPAGGADDSWLTAGNYTVYGTIRLI